MATFNQQTYIGSRRRLKKVFTESRELILKETEINTIIFPVSLNT